MKKIKASAAAILIVSFLFIPTLSRSQIDINIHYLGHSAFLMDFNDFTAVTDFGTSYCWGYNSPIYGFGDYIPTIMSFSHYHNDHYDPSRIPSWVPYTLDMNDSLSIMSLMVTPVRTCENTVGVESNTSFTYNYNGYSILHLGDAQAEIMNIADPSQQALILEKFPDRIDVLLMTIEGIHQFIPEAEMFIDLLQPGIVIPMHYWSPEYKEEFLTYLEWQNDTAGKHYNITRHDGPVLVVNTGDTLHNDIIVYSLTPFPYGETGINKHPDGSDNQALKILSSYPNPCRNAIYLTLQAEQAMLAETEIRNMAGQIVMHHNTSTIEKGINHMKMNIQGLDPGTYIITLKTSELKLSKKFIVH